MSTIGTATALAPQLTLVTAPLLPRKPIVLLVGDQPDRLQRLRLSLGNEQAEFITATNLAELPQRCGQSYAFAIVDFDPAQLPQALATLRTSQATQNILILVEDSRLNDPVRLAGVLPQHRAMACSWRELLTLAQKHLQVPHRSYEPLRRVF
jgi:CheY-like chemotaxis protein